MIDPDANFAASAVASVIVVAVEPLCGITAGKACAPVASGAAPFAGASKFMCCDPVARAIVSLVQLKNSRYTCASSVSRTCSNTAAGIPVNKVEVLLEALRANP